MPVSPVKRATVKWVPLEGRPSTAGRVAAATEMSALGQMLPSRGASDFVRLVPQADKVLNVGRRLPLHAKRTKSAWSKDRVGELFGRLSRDAWLRVLFIAELSRASVGLEGAVGRPE